MQDEDSDFINKYLTPHPGAIETSKEVDLLLRDIMGLIEVDRESQLYAPIAAMLTSISGEVYSMSHASSHHLKY